MILPDRFARVLRAPDVLRLLAAATLARMPIGIDSLAIVLLVRSETGSFARAGVVTAAFGLGIGVTSPVQGRLIDRYGHARVLLPLAGAHVAWLGALVLLALAVLIAIGFGGIGMIMALRTGSAEAVQGLFPLLFVFFFLSTMNLPSDLIQVGWFRHIAEWNPISFLIDGMRSLVITGWDASALLEGLAVGAVILAGSFLLASRALATRMERT